MARKHYWGTVRDKAGNVIPGVTATVYDTATTNKSTIYAAASGGVAITGSHVLTDSTGMWSFWVDRASYPSDADFDVILSADMYNSQTLTGIGPLERETSGSSILKGDGSGGFSTAVFSDIYKLYPAIITKTNSFTVDTTYAFATVHITVSIARTVTIPLASSAYAGMWIDFVSLGSGVVTLTLAVGNWWNEIAVGASVLLSEKTRIWCDGTYWYVSPMEFQIANSRVLNGGTSTATPWAAVNLSAYVPLTARKVWGTLTVSGTAVSMYVGPRSDQWGSVSVGYAGETIVPFKMALVTPQTLYYVVAGSALGYIDIVGFGF